MKHIRLMKMIGSGNPIHIIDGLYIQANRNLLDTLTRKRATLSADLIGYEEDNSLKISKPKHNIHIEYDFIISFNQTSKEDEVELLIYSRKTKKAVFIRQYPDKLKGESQVKFICSKDNIVLDTIDPVTHESIITIIDHNGVVGEMPLFKEYMDTEINEEMIQYGAIPFTESIYAMVYGCSKTVYSDIRRYTNTGRIKVLFIRPRDKKVLHAYPKRYSGKLELGTGIRLIGTYENNYYERVRKVPKEKIESVIENWLRN